MTNRQWIAMLALTIATIAAIAYDAWGRNLLDESRCIRDRSIALTLDMPEPACWTEGTE